jgi:hypothetical protein
MEIKLTVDDDKMDEIIANELLEQYTMSCYMAKSCKLKADREYYKKLSHAAAVVYNHYKPGDGTELPE